MMKWLHWFLTCSLWCRTDHDGIITCKFCGRKWFFSYLGGGTHVEVTHNPDLENYIRHG